MDTLVKSKIAILPSLALGCSIPGRSEPQVFVGHIEPHMGTLLDPLFVIVFFCIYFAVFIRLPLVGTFQG